MLQLEQILVLPHSIKFEIIKSLGIYTVFTFAYYPFESQVTLLGIFRACGDFLLSFCSTIKQSIIVVNNFVLLLNTILIH